MATLNYDILYQVSQYLPDKSCLQLALADSTLNSMILENDGLLRRNVLEFLEIWQGSNGEKPQNKPENQEMGIGDDDEDTLRTFVTGEYGQKKPLGIAYREKCFKGSVLEHALRTDDSTLLGKIMAKVDLSTMVSKTPGKETSVHVKALLEACIYWGSVNCLRVLMDGVVGMKDIILGINASTAQDLLPRSLKKNNLQIITLLKQRGFLHEDMDFWVELLDSARSREMATLLLSQCKDTGDSIQGTFMLRCQRMWESNVITEVLLDHGVDRGVSTRFNDAPYTPLTIAAGGLNISMMKTFLCLGFDVVGSYDARRDRKGELPLSNVLFQKCQSSPGLSCPWSHHISEKDQKSDFLDRLDGDTITQTRMRSYDHCDQCHTLAWAEPVQWLEQVRLLSERQLGAAKMLLDNGAGQYINKTDAYGLPAFQSFIMSVYSFIEELAKNACWPTVGNDKSSRPSQWVREAGVEREFGAFGIICDLLLEAGANPGLEYQMAGLDMTGSSGLERLMKFVDNYHERRGYPEKSIRNQYA